MLMLNTFSSVSTRPALRSAMLATVAMFSLVLSQNARAQFSKPVVVLKGIVRSEETSKPTSVKVSVRIVGDTAREITSSTSNKETGRYLVVLKPGKTYWVHLEGDSVLTKDIMVTTPESDKPTQVEQDFTVALREVAAPDLKKDTN
jgi:hypothetical protein